MDIENTDLDDNSIRLAEATVSDPLRGEQPPQIVRSRLSNSMLGSGPTTPQDYRE
jgi:hypothetical protein